MDWIWPALCDWVWAMERRSRRSSVSWDSRAELFFWDWEIWMTSQRNRAAKIMATTNKTEFMDYYFTRAERNSPLRERERKKINTEGTEVRQEITEKTRCDTKTSTRWGAACCAPTEEVTRL